MSDLILTLSHYHRHSDLRSADNRHDARLCLLRDLRFTLLYIVV